VAGGIIAGHSTFNQIVEWRTDCSIDGPSAGGRVEGVFDTLKGRRVASIEEQPRESRRESLGLSRRRVQIPFRSREGILGAKSRQVGLHVHEIAGWTAVAYMEKIAAFSSLSVTASSNLTAFL